MGIPLHELQLYKNFDDLARELLDLAKQIMPGKLIYLSSLNDKQQTILKLSDSHTEILISEGMVINLNETLCHRVNFDNNSPLIYEDLSKEDWLGELEETLIEVNIKSYLGIPIYLIDGKVFGTLCVAHNEGSHFDKQNINILQRIAKMFSYWLELERLAYRDSLTGLYNRQYLYKQFETNVKSEGTIFFLDLDGFKSVNDIYGHETGDLLLKEVAFKLNEFIKDQSDAFAVRLGGDEFIVNFPYISNKKEVCKQAEYLLNYLNTWTNELDKCQLSASIGIVSYPENNSTSLKSLLSNADKALYCSKAAGKNTYHLFNGNG
ncbi:sensor domain-containing diguanylate cyclase [Alkalihalophilus marmarensis]|uniref:sensor domain-containing diguanylate cyclase n=1 Tax=Alkalihalophilus marmarensis TaxID=521377 RepID=UPI002DBB4BA2|nr:diguanylate cyclase [Alkalihalophilus marmarensis]MEC2071999.1 diguanylate cyclase [Alkalihalophilus marmarensis]